MNEFQIRISDTLYKEAALHKDDGGMLAFFLIGCYPNIGGNAQHEDLPIIRQIEHDTDLPLMIFLIDGNYDDGYKPPYLPNIQAKKGVYRQGRRRVVIYDKNLNDHEFYQILEVANFVSHLNCATYVASFTGKDLDTETMNKAVYIAPSNCLGDVSEIGYNPIIQIDQGKPYFYNPQNIKDIYQEYELLYESYNNNICDQLQNELQKKMQFLDFNIKRILTVLKRGHIRAYHHINNTNDTMRSVVRGGVISPCYQQNIDITEESIRHLYYRCQGYDLYLIKNLVERWLKSNIACLVSFLEQDIERMLLFIFKITYREQKQLEENKLRHCDDYSYSNMITHFMERLDNH